VLVSVSKGLVKARLSVEYAHFHMTDNLQAFSCVWAEGGALCLVGGDGELILKF